MGIRPQLYFGVALPGLETEDSNPKGWPKDWDKIEIPYPSQERMQHSRALADLAHSLGDYEGEHKHIHDVFMFEGARGAFYINRFLHKKVGDFVRYDSEYELKGRAFYVIEESRYAPYWLYALAALHEEYREPGFHEVPLLPVDDDHSEYAIAWKLSKRGEPVRYPLATLSYQEVLDNNHNYRAFSLYGQLRFHAPLWLFREALKLDIQLKDLKLGILVTWG